MEERKENEERRKPKEVSTHSSIGPSLFLAMSLSVSFLASVLGEKKSEQSLPFMKSITGAVLTSFSTRARSSAGLSVCKDHKKQEEADIGKRVAYLWSRGCDNCGKSGCPFSKFGSELGSVSTFEFINNSSCLILRSSSEVSVD
jgi:hypothetical protein